MGSIASEPRKEVRIKLSPEQLLLEVEHSDDRPIALSTYRRHSLADVAIGIGDALVDESDQETDWETIAGIELRRTLASLRDAKGPATCLHALIAQDDLSRPQIAAIIEDDPIRIEPILVALVNVGYVTVRADDDRMLYSLARTA